MRWARRAYLPAAGLLTAAVVAGSLFFDRCLPEPLFAVPYATILLDRDEQLLGAAIAADEQWRFPPADRVAPKFAQAITCFEDRRFFHHPGVDPLALARAIWTNLREGRVISGASTLTMQVIRLARQGRPRTVGEKTIEMLLALRLEWRADKAQILALYAAHAPFGGNVVGLEAAAWRFFGRAPDTLSWAESATLAVLPNSPALIHPGKNRRHLRRKRDALLERLRRQGRIDALTCRLAQAEPLPPQPFPLPRLAPHLLERARRNTPVQTGTRPGRIHTTLQKNLQVRASEIVNRHSRRLAGNGIHNAAALVLAVNGGQVLAYVGNSGPVGQALRGHAVDVVMAPRSSGSILKPLLYAGMLQAGELLPTQLVADIPTRIGGFAPQNYTRSYQGAVPAAMALARSLNVPAVRLLRRYGVARFYTLLQTLGLGTLHRRAEDYGLSLILGGAETSLWEITGIYAGLARSANRSHRAGPGAIFAPPRYQGAHDGAGKRSLAHAPPLDPAACWQAIQAMLEVTRPGIEARWRQFDSSRPVAWKTGTSFGLRDGWAIGITPRHAVGVWVGNADGEGRPGLTGIGAAAPIMFDLFGLLGDDGWFQRPDDLLFEVEVCAHSGYRSGPHCESKRKVAVARVGRRTGMCPYCRIVHCDVSGQWRVHGDCQPVAAISPRNWFVLPPAMEWFYRQNHAHYRSLPPLRRDCVMTLSASPTAAMTLIRPAPHSRIFIPLEMDGRRGRTVFKAAHRHVDRRIFWHLDAHYLGTTRGLHQMALAPTAGMHTLTIVDEDGARVSRRFTVVSRVEDRHTRRLSADLHWPGGHAHVGGRKSQANDPDLDQPDPGPHGPAQPVIDGN
jgi:penicillin-binding protein 1C